MTHAGRHAMSDAEMQRCIAACLDAHAACLAAAAHCLEMGGLHAARKQQVTMLDCADMCLTAAHFMLRGSPRHQATCRLCAEACRDCERACGEIAHGDEVMARCIEACRRSAESCERMTAHLS